MLCFWSKLPVSDTSSSTWSSGKKFRIEYGAPITIGDNSGLAEGDDSARRDARDNVVVEQSGCDQVFGDNVVLAGSPAKIIKETLFIKRLKAIGKETSYWQHQIK